MSPARVPAVPGGTSALRPPPARSVLAPAPARTSDQVSPTTPEPATSSISSRSPEIERAVSEVPAAPPPARRSTSREQLNTKIGVDLRRRLNDFVGEHNSTVQGVLEAALDEYMSRRGWSWEDYRRSSEHG